MITNMTTDHIADHTHFTIHQVGNLSSPPPTTEPLYYVSYVPMSQVDVASVSAERYATLLLAQKNAQKKMGFRKRLLDTCQNEFQSAGMIHSIYIPCLHILSTHPINTLYLHTLSTHPINTPYQHILSTHPINI